MADLYPNILTYSEFLDLSGKTAEEYPETGLALLMVKPTVDSKLKCLGSVTPDTMSQQAKDILVAWLTLFIVSRFAGITSDNTGGILKKIDDGFVSEEFHIPDSAVSQDSFDTELTRLWALLSAELYPDSEEVVGGIGVVNRDSRKLALSHVCTQNTSPVQ